MIGKPSANPFGYASLVLSLSFWVLLTLHFIPGFPKIDLSFNYWIGMWAAALFMALVAAARGSGRWALAAIIPLANFFVLIFLSHAREPR